MAVDIKNYVTTDSIELNVDLVKQIKGLDGYVLPHKRLEAAVKLVDEIEKQLAPDDRGKLNGNEDTTVYECVCCSTIFKEEHGEHNKGVLVCPSCGSEDLLKTYEGPERKE